MRLVITGSSSGIGYALTEYLLKKGNHVLGIARSSQPDLTKRFPCHFSECACDVANWNELEAAAKGASAFSFDGIICCAGSQGPLGPAVTVDPLRWSEAVRTNLDGTFYTIRAFFSLLTKIERAKIICFSGGGATKARPNFSAYSASKTGVVRLVETISSEFTVQTVDINAVAPGAINTRLTDEVIALGPEVVGVAEYASATKQKADGGGSLEKLFALVDFLLSPLSDGISGRLISAPWDQWNSLPSHATELKDSDIFTLRRIIPEDRAKQW